MDFAEVNERNAKTIGEQLYVTYGITGVRGQAEAGFPAVREIGLPVYQDALNHGSTANHAGAITLLHLIANIDDTSLIHRSSRERHLEVQKDLQKFLKKDPRPALDVIYALDQKFVAENLSPGGAADMLAMTYFLANIERTI